MPEISPPYEHTESSQDGTKLPEQYSHFDNLDRYVKDLNSLKKDGFPQEMYSTAWVILCMSIDKSDQNGPMGSLTDNTPDDTSAFAVYQRLKQHLQEEHYVDKKLNTFKLPSDESRAPYFDPTRAELLKAASAYCLTIYDKNLCDWSFGALAAKKYPEGEFMAQFYNTQNLLEELHKSGGEKYIPYVALTMLLGGARLLSSDYLLNNINQIHNGQTRIIDKELKINSLLVNSEPYHHLTKSLLTALIRAEKEVFDEQSAEEAGSLWRTLIFMRTSQLPDKVRAKDAREPIVKALVEKNYFKAKIEIEDLMSKYPNLFPDFVINQLGIDPQGWAKMQEEIKEEIQSNTPPKKGKNELVREELDKLREKLSTLTDQELISADGERIIVIKQSKVNGRVPRFYIKFTKGGDEEFKDRQSIIISPAALTAYLDLGGFIPKPTFTPEDFGPAVG